MLIIANWKCNPVSVSKAKELLKVKEGENNVEVIICPPYLYLPMVVEGIKNRNIKVGAQNCFWENKGAYTGEVSPLMLSNMGCDYVIVGHSERRSYLNEDSKILNKKIKKALSNNLKVIFCVGESQKERNNGETLKVIKKQIDKGLKGVKNENICIAYEPIWAIGSGSSCLVKDAEKVLDFIKEKRDVKVLYGGSINEDNALSYIESKFNGLLIGGASLNPEKFNKIIKQAKD